MFFDLQEWLLMASGKNTNYLQQQVLLTSQR